MSKSDNLHGLHTPTSQSPSVSPPHNPVEGLRSLNQQSIGELLKGSRLEGGNPFPWDTLGLDDLRSFYMVHIRSRNGELSLSREDVTKLLANPLIKKVYQTGRQISCSVEQGNTGAYLTFATDYGEDLQSKSGPDMYDSDTILAFQVTKGGRFKPSLELLGKNGMMVSRGSLNESTLAERVETLRANPNVVEIPDKVFAVDGFNELLRNLGMRIDLK